MSRMQATIQGCHALKLSWLSFQHDYIANIVTEQLTNMNYEVKTEYNVILRTLKSVMNRNA